jgi:hypothetical protein
MVLLIVRSYLVVSPVSPLMNDKVVIAKPSRFIPIQLRQEVRENIADIVTEVGYTMTALDDHPFGIGIFTLVDVLAADAVVGLTFELDEDTTVTFVKHDQARNMRLTSFGREIWVQFLGFPLDYQTSHYVNRACEDFCLVSHWFYPRGNKKYVLVKVWVADPKFVPKSLIMQQLGGPRRSWGIPVIMLHSMDWNAHIRDVPLPPKDPEPVDGNPHPMYGIEQTVEHIYQQQVNNWLQQNGAPQNVGNQGQNVGHQNALFPPQAHEVMNQIYEDPPLINFQAILAKQGVPYFAGVHPPVTNIVDSPMQAWNDSIVSSDSEASMMSSQSADIQNSEVSTALTLNSMIMDTQSTFQTHCAVWAQLSIAKQVMQHYAKPSMALITACFLIVREPSLPPCFLSYLVSILC